MSKNLNSSGRKDSSGSIGKSASSSAASVSHVRRYVAAHATEMKENDGRDYFDLEHMTDPNAAFYVSMAAIGEAEVGKTSLLLRFAKRRYEARRIMTVAYDYSSHWIKTNHPHYDRLTQVTLYDTAGQERHRAFGASILRDVEAVMLVFDATNRVSFEKCKEWRELIKKNNNWCICMLVANKIDLYKEKKPTSNEFLHPQWLLLPDTPPATRVLALASGEGVVDLTQAAVDLQCAAGAAVMSAASGEGVDEAFVELVDLAVERQIQISLDFNKKKGGDEQQRGGTRKGKKLNLHESDVKVTQHNTTTKISFC